MPFGAKGVSYKFQEVAEEVTRGCPVEGVSFRTYVEDVLLLAETMEALIQGTEWLLKRCEEVNLRIHPAKSIFAASRFEFLGFAVELGRGDVPGTLSPKEVHFRALGQLPVPPNLKALRSSLGAMSFFRQLVPGFGVKAKALFGLCQKGVRFEMTRDLATSWKKLIREVCEAAVVPFDEGKEAFVHTDYSVAGVGGILTQAHDGRHRLVGCVSRGTTEAESRYSSTAGEALAAVYAIRSFRLYLLGVKFTLITDASSLQWLLRPCREHTYGMHIRWALQLSEHPFDIVHRAGFLNSIPDALSRSPLLVPDYTGTASGPMVELSSGPGHRFLSEEEVWTEAAHLRTPLAMLAALAGLGACGRGGGGLGYATPAGVPWKEVSKRVVDELVRRAVVEPLGPAPPAAGRSRCGAGMGRAVARGRARG